MTSPGEQDRMSLIREIVKQEVINLWKGRSKKKKGNPFGGMTNPLEKGPSLEGDVLSEEDKKKEGKDV